MNLVYGNYYLILILQGFCVYHCLRNNNSNQWLWLIIFLPLIGGLIYLFQEVITRGQIQSTKQTFNLILRPQGSIKQLEKNLAFSDSFENKMALGNAFYYHGEYTKALNLYTACCNGLFDNTPELVFALMQTNYQLGNYQEVVTLHTKVENHPDYQRSLAQLDYALSSEKVNRLEEAEAIFQKFNTRYDDFEGRLAFAEFLIRNKRSNEAMSILTNMKDEAKMMSFNEKRNHRNAIQQGNSKLKELQK